MTKHFLNWKDTTVKSAGKKTALPYLSQIDRYYTGTLLSRILAMEKQTAISLEAAIHLLIENEQAARAAGRKGAEPGQMFWYAGHFVEWLSEIGYHVELTGDEFEPLIMSDKVA
jgi:hypothetical protein